MVSHLAGCLDFLRPAFSRRAAFAWFVVVFAGIVLRADTLGVSSIVRALSLPPACYEPLLHFFHSAAWDVPRLAGLWQDWVMSRNAAHLVNGRVVLIGDHTKTPKDGRRMPAVTTLHQDSETASKPSFFRGHHWGCLALLATAGKKHFAVPLEASIQEGTGALDDTDAPKTVRIVQMARRFVERTGCAAYLVLDAYFAVGPVFAAAAGAAGGIERPVHILTRAKNNVVAYRPAPPPKAGTRGRKPIYGKKLKLAKLFDSRPGLFQSARAEVYGSEETVRYLAFNLLWKPVRGELRFILVETPRGRLILVSSDLSLEPIAALQLYCRRAAIETLFNTLKNLVGGMRYHFWSSYLPAASRRPRKKENPPQASSRPDKTKDTLQAIEKYVFMHLLVIGVLQLLALNFSGEIKDKARCWLRTVSSGIPSEFVTRAALGNAVNFNLRGFASDPISLLIRQKQNPFSCDRGN